LVQLRLLARYLRQQPVRLQASTLATYHQRQAEALKMNEAPEVFALRNKIAPITKAKIERPVEVILAAAPNKTGQTAPEEAAGLAKDDVSTWKALAEDTRLNETTRRQQIHELLADAGLTTPDKLTRPIYKNVLHADLDDPYLGLGKALFETYPF